MKQFKEKLEKMDATVFEKLNKVLKESGIKDVEISSINLASKVALDNINCPTGQTLVCRIGKDGKKICRCVKM